jgi:hypothetical protein
MLPACCRSRSVTLYLQRVAAMLALRSRGHSFVRGLHKIN